MRHEELVELAKAQGIEVSAELTNEHLEVIVGGMSKGDGFGGPSTSRGEIRKRFFGQST